MRVTQVKGFVKGVIRVARGSPLALFARASGSRVTLALRLADPVSRDFRVSIVLQVSALFMFVYERSIPYLSHHFFILQFHYMLHL